jgi:hypothetical protein
MDVRMTKEEALHLLRDFQLPNHKNVYILGCFAKYVTLYSQQVRALNLIAALLKTGVLRKHGKIAIVGAGAGGLTAAAGAAVHDLDVTILEELEGSLEFQSSNRQRWLHPHIYDWPNEEFQNDPWAHLPLLDWKADYAEKVATQIGTAWEAIANTHSVKQSFNVHDISLKCKEKNVELTWNERMLGGNKIMEGIKFDAVILAVGFGLEEAKPNYCWSYWSEDDIDGRFRRSERGQRWLISGSGDGALTDLMRLCISRFRHGEVLTLFSKATGYGGLKSDLKRIHSQPGTTPEMINEYFQNELNVAPLVDRLIPRLRTQRPDIFVAVRSHLYGPESAILNRLIVLVLQKAGAFSLLKGETKVKAIKKGYKITLNGAKYEKTFDRVILRHGPVPVIRKIVGIADDCETLQSDWKNKTQQDETRKRQWAYGYFSVERGVSVSQSSGFNFADEVKELGISAKGLHLTKTVSDDGSSEMQYQIDALTVHREDLELKGMRLHFVSTTGIVGPPNLDDASIRLGHEWVREDDAPRKRGELGPFQMQLEKQKRMAGVLKFTNPLKKSYGPITFGFTVTILNGDANSAWEDKQIEGPDDALDMDGRRFGVPSQYVRRIIWFPVERISIRISFPKDNPGPPKHTVFSSSRRPSNIVQNDILDLRPAEGIQWNRKELVKGGEGNPTNPEPQTWELEVPLPALGSCHSLAWELPKSHENDHTKELEKGVREFRKALLEHREKLLLEKDLTGKNKAIAQKMRKFYEEVASQCASGAIKEFFEISMMTYNQDSCELELVEGLKNGERPSDETWAAKLPFGVGLAGISFRKADRAFLYLKPDNTSLAEGRIELSPEYYLSVSKGVQHEVLYAIPVHFPVFGKGKFPSDFENARRCVGVVLIGSSSKDSRLKMLNEASFVKLARKCQTFCDSVFAIQFSDASVSSETGVFALQQSPTSPDQIGIATPRGWIRHTAGTFSRPLPKQRVVLRKSRRTKGKL